MIKKILFLLVFTFFCILIRAQKTWTGTGGNKLWNNGLNWSPSGVPVAADNVIINISDSVEINVAVGINSLTITSSSTVIFSNSGTSRTITLSSISAVQLGLLVDAGSSLTVQANIISASTQSLVLALTGAAGVTGEVYGSLYFKSVGSGSGGSATLLNTYNTAANYAQLKVKSGGLIKYDDKTSNTISSGTPLNTITMEAGSTYWVNKNGGSFPDGSWAATSLCKSTGMFASGPTFNGSSYGNMEWNCPNQSAVYSFNKDIAFNDITITNANSNAIRVKTGAAASSPTLTVNGTLHIAAGVTVETTGSTATAPNGGVIELKGNLVNNGVLTEGGPAGTRDTIIFKGSSLQTITGTGTVTNQQTFKIDNAAGVTITQPLSLPYLLVLKTGIVNTSTAGLLTLQSGCSLTTSASTGYTNLNAAGLTNYGSEASYIIGPVRKLGLSATTRWAFPVGSVTHFRPMFLTTVTGDFTVEYKQASPQVAFGTTYGSGIDHVSNIEYWIVSGASSPTANVQLTFYDPNSGGVTVMADLRVANYDGSSWINVGNSATLGSPGTNGSVASSATTSFNNFALASSTAQNALPLKTIDLTATRNNRQVDLKWQVNADGDVKEYVLEKSFSGRSFVPVYQTHALNSSQSLSYHFADVANNAKVMYRVKVVLQNGQFLYSSIAILPGSNESFVLMAYPNPVVKTLHLTASKSGGQIMITDLSGKNIYSAKMTGSNIAVDVSQWPAGYYHVRLIQVDKAVTVKKFIVSH